MRTLRRSPGFAVLVVATVALGIGMTTTIYSGVVVCSLPYADADRLVVGTTRPDAALAAGGVQELAGVSGPDVQGGARGCGRFRRSRSSSSG